MKTLELFDHIQKKFLLQFYALEWFGHFQPLKRKVAGYKSTKIFTEFFLTASVNEAVLVIHMLVLVLLYTLVQNRCRARSLAVKMRNAFSH